MLLRELEQDENWLISKWQLTYSVSWEHIQKAVYAAFDSFVRTDILTSTIQGSITEIETINKDSVMLIEEAASMTIRGMSRILGVPLMITFYNQTNVVELFVAKATDEFKTADYKQFNLSMCQFLDSIELAMYR